METTKQTSKDYFKALSTLHLVLTISLVLFGLIETFLILSGIVVGNPTDLDLIFLLLLPILIFSSLLYSTRVYKNKLGELKEENNLRTKMTNYRSALIVRYAFLEWPAFLALLAVILTSNLLFLAFAGLMIVFIIYWRPTKNSVITDLGLSQQEIAIIENPDSVIAELINTNKH